MVPVRGGAPGHPAERIGGGRGSQRPAYSESGAGGRATPLQMGGGLQAQLPSRYAQRTYIVSRCAQAPPFCAAAKLAGHRGEFWVSLGGAYGSSSSSTISGSGGLAGSIGASFGPDHSCSNPRTYASPYQRSGSPATSMLLTLSRSKMRTGTRSSRPTAIPASVRSA